MTRRFDTLVQCPECGAWHTQETPFERWMRNSQDLDSRIAGIVRFDCDVLLHRYRTECDKRGARDIQCIMFIEVKCRGANVDDAQRDTLSMFSQVLRNRKTNRHQKRLGRHAGNHTPYAQCYSQKMRRPICLRMYGGHLLRMAGDEPTGSDWILWDNKPITEEQLIGILKFDLDPDSLEPIDWRRRYSDFEERNSQKTFYEFGVNDSPQAG